MVDIYSKYDIERVEEKPNPRKEISLIKAEIRDKLFNLRQKSASFSNRGTLDDDDRLRAIKVNKQIEHWKKVKKQLDVNNYDLINKYKKGHIEKNIDHIVKTTEKGYRDKLSNKYKQFAVVPRKNATLNIGAKKITKLNFFGVSR